MGWHPRVVGSYPHTGQPLGRGRGEFVITSRVSFLIRTQIHFNRCSLSYLSIPISLEMITTPMDSYLRSERRRENCVTPTRRSQKATPSSVPPRLFIEAQHEFPQGSRLEQRTLAAIFRASFAVHDIFARSRSLSSSSISFSPTVSSTHSPSIHSSIPRDDEYDVVSFEFVPLPVRFFLPSSNAPTGDDPSPLDVLLARFPW